MRAEAGYLGKGRQSFGSDSKTHSGKTRFSGLGRGGFCFSVLQCYILFASSTHMKPILKFFDRFEDKIRGRLSRYPIAYGIVGGIGIVLFWRGVWHTADLVTAVVWAGRAPAFFELIDGPLSFLLGTTILLSTGLFVASFIGSSVLLSGLRGEKKMSEKTEAEVRAEETEIAKIQRELRKIETDIQKMDSHDHPGGPGAKS
jgi:hypothetical protein